MNQSLREYLDTIPVLYSGEHPQDSDECCILEATSRFRGLSRKTDDPETLNVPDIRRLNDACWPTDEMRTVQMRRLAPLLESWPTWDEARRKAYTDRVALRTIREILPMVLQEPHASACRDAATLADALTAAAADAAADAADAARAAYTTDAARAARAASRAAARAALAAASAARAASAASAASASAAAVLTRAVDIWSEEVQ